MSRRREGVDITLAILFGVIFAVVVVVCCGAAWMIGAWAG